MARVSDVSTVVDARASRSARIRAAKELGLSDDEAAWAALLGLARDDSVHEELALEVGAALARIAHRIRQRGAIVRGEQ